MLLNIDSESVFQIISILFFPGKPFDFLKEGVKLAPEPKVKDEDGMEIDDFSRERVTHNNIINALRQVCTNLNNDQIKLQYLFFVSTIAVTCDIEQDSHFYYSIVKDLLKEHVKFLQYNEHALQRTMSKDKMYKIINQNFNIQAPDEVKHLIKSENDLI